MMPIDIVNVMLASICTGLFTKWGGWSAFAGSILGNLVYYAWLRGVLFG